MVSYLDSVSFFREESATKDEKRSKEHLDEVLNEYDIEYEVSGNEKIKFVIIV